MSFDRFESGQLVQHIFHQMKELKKFIDQTDSRITATQQGMDNVFKFTKDNINRLETQVCEMKEVVDELEGASDISSVSEITGHSIMWTGYGGLSWQELRLLLI